MNDDDDDDTEFVKSHVSGAEHWILAHDAFRQVDIIAGCWPISEFG